MSALDLQRQSFIDADHLDYLARDKGPFDVTVQLGGETIVVDYAEIGWAQMALAAANCRAFAGFRDNGDAALVHVLRHAVRPDIRSTVARTDPKTGDLLIALQFSDRAPLAIRMTPHEVKLIRKLLKKAVPLIVH